MSTDWQSRANCVEVNPRYFFPLTKAEEAAAKSVCAGCEVRDDCYQFALTSNRGGREQFGIFGGINFEQWRRDHRTEIQLRSRKRRRESVA